VKVLEQHSLSLIGIVRWMVTDLPLCLRILAVSRTAEHH
jgi:hypothetical protein